MYTLKLLVGSLAECVGAGISLLTIDSDGTVTKELLWEGTHAGFLAFHPNGNYIYSIGEKRENGEFFEGWIDAFQWDEQNHKLTHIDRIESGGKVPCHISIHPNGRWLIVSNYISGTLSVIELLPNGSFSPEIETYAFDGSGPHPNRQTSSHLHSAIFSPCLRYLCVQDLGGDEIVVFPFDSKTGLLETGNKQVYKTPPGSGPRHLVFHDYLPQAAVNYELSHQAEILDWNAESGRFAHLQSASTIPEAFSNNVGISEIRYTHDHEKLLVANRGHDSIVQYGLSETGRIIEGSETWINVQGESPRHFNLSKDDQWLATANELSNSISLFKRDGGNEWAFYKTVGNLHAPGWVYFL